MKTTIALLVGFAFFMTAAIASSDAAPSTCGKASWYAMTSLTASGERASPNTMTAAHKTLPFGTKVRVTNQRNGKAVVVRINDRGPYAKGRIIDLTKTAAGKLGFINAGWTNVKVEPLNKLSHPRVKALTRAC
jgi:rare lipoprotein A